MSEAKTYVGSCHCGKVRYEATADLSKPMECNCSMCARKGAVMTFVPAESFSLKSGQGETTDYQFNKKNIHHLFCKTCGIHAYATGKGRDGKEMVMLNLRCLDDVDVASMKPTTFDGKSL